MNVVYASAVHTTVDRHHLLGFCRNGVVGVGILVIGVTVILIFYPRESDEDSEKTSKQVM
jgi:hypothetical protein